MKAKIPEYLAEKTDCPAKKYKHKADVNYCYAHTFYHQKRGGLSKDAPVCNEDAEYCEWNNPNREVSDADRKKPI